MISGKLLPSCQPQFPHGKTLPGVPGVLGDCFSCHACRLSACPTSSIVLFLDWKFHRSPNSKGNSMLAVNSPSSSVRRWWLWGAGRGRLPPEVTQSSVQAPAPSTHSPARGGPLGNPGPSPRLALWAATFIESVCLAAGQLCACTLQSSGCRGLGRRAGEAGSPHPHPCSWGG